VVALRLVSRSRRVVRTANPDTTAAKQVFSVAVEQPAGAAHTAFAYALVPHATEDALAGYARGPLSVLANTTSLQAVRHTGLGLLAANAFTGGTHHAGPLTLDGPASVILREERDGTTSLAVADPTTGRDTVSVLLHGRAPAQVSADDGVAVSRVPGGTRIDVTTRQAYGRSFQAVLR
jgi:hyaluronate lyase